MIDISNTSIEKKFKFSRFIFYHQGIDILASFFHFRYRSDPKLLLLSDLVESEEAEISGGEFQGSKDGSSPFTHLILQDLFASDFQMAEIDRDENGLDFTHTILALAKLATFHAVSYCMKKEKDMDFQERYELLSKKLQYIDFLLDTIAYYLTLDN